MTVLLTIILRNVIKDTALFCNTATKFFSLATSCDIDSNHFVLSTDSRLSINDVKHTQAASVFTRLNSCKHKKNLIPVLNIKHFIPLNIKHLIPVNIKHLIPVNNSCKHKSFNSFKL